MLNLLQEWLIRSGSLSAFQFIQFILIMDIWKIKFKSYFRSQEEETYLKIWTSPITSQRPTSPHSLQAPISRKTSTYSNTDSQVRSLCWERDWTHQNTRQEHQSALSLSVYSTGTTWHSNWKLLLKILLFILLVNCSLILQGLTETLNYVATGSHIHPFLWWSIFISDLNKTIERSFLSHRENKRVIPPNSHIKGITSRICWSPSVNAHSKLAPGIYTALLPPSFNTPSILSTSHKNLTHHPPFPHREHNKLADHQ